MEMNMRQIITESATDSALVISDAFLTRAYEASNFQKLLTMFSSEKEMEKYRSICDMLLCSIFPEYRASCMKFYSGKGKRLAEIATEEEIVLLDKAVYISLLTANEVVKRKFHISSRKEFIGTCREVIRQAIPNSEETVKQNTSIAIN